MPSIEELAKLLIERNADKIAQRVQLKEKQWKRFKRICEESYANIEKYIKSGTVDMNGVECLTFSGMDSTWIEEFKSRFNKDHNPVPGSILEVKPPAYIGGPNTIYIVLIPRWSS